MNEFVALEKEGQCIYTGLDTHFKHRGCYTSQHFLLAGRKLWLKFKDSEPDLTLEDAIDIIISAQSYRVMFGEGKMEVSEVRKEGETWKNKVTKIFKRQR